MRRAANPWDRFYRFHAAPWRGERAVADLLPLATGPVLELGVGNGKMLRPLEAAGVDVVGLDVAWHALRRLGRGVLADAAVLPFRDASFALVLDVHCTGHLDDAGRAVALRESHRVLRPGGHLVLERLGVEDLRAGGHATRVLEDGRSTHFSSLEGLRADAEAADFQVVQADEHRRTPSLRGRRVVRHSVRITCQKAG